MDQQGSNSTFYWSNPSEDNSGQQNGNTFIHEEIESQQHTSEAQPEELRHQSLVETPSPSSSDQTSLQSDMASHSGIRPNQVIQVPNQIINPEAIIPKSRTYTCRICGMKFNNKSEVTMHSRIHTDQTGKPYRCHFCGKGFSTNFYLKQHERIHSGAKPYKCPMCDRRFKQLSHVQQHVRTHTGVRPYKCRWPGCGKAFLQQSHLKSHEARHLPKDHNGEKPYSCHWPDCGKSFAQLSNLKCHLARHTARSKPKVEKASHQTSVVLSMAPSQAELNRLQSLKNGENGIKTEASGQGIHNNQYVKSEEQHQDLNDVINQAAAAANIVPTFIEEEQEIRPFLCPGCSKLYVREATFKKHLEECKLKLQRSITQVASSLGLPTPAMPDFSPIELHPTPPNLPASITPMISKPLQYEPPDPQKTASNGSQGLSGVTLDNLMSSAGIIPSSSAASSPRNDQIIKEPVSEAVVVSPNDVIKNRVPTFGNYKVVYNSGPVGVSNRLSSQQKSSSSSSNENGQQSEGQVNGSQPNALYRFPAVNINPSVVSQSQHQQQVVMTSQQQPQPRETMTPQQVTMASHQHQQGIESNLEFAGGATPRQQDSTINSNEIKWEDWSSQSPSNGENNSNQNESIPRIHFN